VIAECDVPDGTGRSEFMKAWWWPVLCAVSMALAIPGHVPAQEPQVEPEYVGSLGVMLGVYSADKLDTSNIGGASRQRQASDMYLLVTGTRRLVDHLHLAASIGALSRGDVFIRDSSFLTRARLTIFPLSMGLRFYPVALAHGRRILPYLSAGGSLVVGVQVFERSTFQFDYSSDTRLALGGTLGAGLDYRVAERILLGLYGGYQRARFSRPLSDLPGGVSDFSGPQFLFTFSYLISGAGGGPRGEGNHGN
jgi:hypothetical protein